MTVTIGDDIAVAPVATADASLKSVKMKMGTGLNVAAGDSTAVQVPVLPVGDGNKFTVTVWAHRADQPGVAVELTRTQNTGGSLLRANLGYARYTLGGPFSVSSSKKVIFSKGNLQYNADATTWRFAEHHYDYIGSDNSNIADDYDGWIDLFGWGTGNNPTNTSTNADDYPAPFQDWGTAASGNIGSGWYTLSYPEWKYVFDTRTTSTKGLTGTDNGIARYTKANVNSINGVILFPDDFTMPADVTVTGSSTFNGAYTYFDKFVVTSGWDKMELAGAIFLPISGRRNGTTVVNTDMGFYWSMNKTGTSGYTLAFQNGGLNAQCTYYASYSTTVFYGHAVRLVKTL